MPHCEWEFEIGGALMQGKLIIIEGLDGSGKATQTRLLKENLEKLAVPVRAISFPDYESPASAPAKMYLDGAFGREAGDVNAYAASTFYAVDRFASYRSKAGQGVQTKNTGWGSFLKGGGVVIADRYTTSNAVHQCCKLPKEEWDAYLNWLFNFEYTVMGIPAPTMVIYLDMAPEVSQKLMSARYLNNEEKKDIHERDVAYLQAARKATAYCAEKYGWRRIACDNGQNPYTVEEIAEKVLFAVQSCF